MTLVREAPQLVGGGGIWSLFGRRPFFGPTDLSELLIRQLSKGGTTLSRWHWPLAGESVSKAFSTKEYPATKGNLCEYCEKLAFKMITWMMMMMMMTKVVFD